MSEIEEKKSCKICSPIYNLEYDDNGIGEYTMETVVKAPRVVCLIFEGWMNKCEDVDKSFWVNVFIDGEENNYSKMEGNELAIILDNESSEEQHIKVQSCFSDAFKDMKVRARLFCECCVEYEKD